MGLKIATNTVVFASEFFFPFATKISGEVANLQLIFSSALSKQKGYHTQELRAHILLC